MNEDDVQRRWTSSKQNDRGETPFDLLLGCSDDADSDGGAQRASLVSTIIEAGWVDVNKPDPKSGRIALHSACQYSDPSVVRVVLKHTQTVDRKDRQGITPYQLARGRQDLAVITAILQHKRAHLDNDEMTMTAEEQSCLYLAELIARRDPSFLSRPNRQGDCLTLLQCGAYYLDVSIVRAAISLEHGPGKTSIKVPFWIALTDWQNGLASKLHSLNDHHLFWTPLFIAMNSAFQKQQEAGEDGSNPPVRDRFRDVFDALVPIPNLYLGDRGWMDVKDQALKMRLIDSCCDGDMIGRMAQLGLTLPWELLGWRDDNTVYVAPYHYAREALVFYDLSKLDTVLSVVHSGHCRFVDILKQNFEFGAAMLGSGCIKLGFLSSEDEQEIVPLLARPPNVEHKSTAHSYLGYRGSARTPDGIDDNVKPHQRVEVLQNLLRLGLDGESTLVRAAQQGRKEEVDLLLKTKDKSVMEAAKTAHDTAMQNGHLEIAGMLPLFSAHADDT
jgi:hypothetical protein